LVILAFKLSENDLIAMKSSSMAMASLLNVLEELRFSTFTESLLDLVDQLELDFDAEEVMACRQVKKINSSPNPELH